MRRVVDVIVAATVMAGLLSVALVTALLIRIRLGGPVLFRQQRIGLDGVPFEIIKFRTMLPEAYPDQDERERRTGLGEFLRATGLDEYPQLWNILRGDMSIIGPRPTLPEQVVEYSARHAGRHDVRPGLTGWAQVNGRNSISWPERIELDLWYIANRSIRLDLRIVALTALRLLRPRDLYGADGINPDYPCAGKRVEAAVESDDLSTRKAQVQIQVELQERESA